VRRLVLFVAAMTAAVGIAASTATASHSITNTGWFCPVLGQMADAGGGYSYVCWSYRWFLVHRN
jgi:hypothetical protein